jgi:hypothetical protein
MSIGLMIFLGTLVVAAEDPQVARIEISPEETTVTVGEDAQFTATAYNSENNAVETTFTWSIDADIEIGEINDGEFTASAAGSGFIVASVGSGDDLVEGKASITVTEEPVETSIEIFPDGATVVINETVQFEAQVQGVEGDVVVTWNVSNNQVGEINNEGLFTAKAEGETKVTATVGDLTDEVDVTVVTEKPPLPEGVNTIDIQRQHPDGKITKFGSTNAEGDTVTIGGIPYPFNYMNGMKLYFPEESIHENIVITIKIPEKVVKINNQKKEVTFEGDIVNAVTFNVSVEGEERNPYDFDTPIELSLPYKKGLLAKLGIEPEDLTIYYIDAEGNLATEGITDVTLDAETNKITGTVAHFSDIAMAPKGETTGVEENSQPIAFTLSQNYPNPFNPETTISYYVSETSHVTISIYNVVGQHIRTLVETVKPAGSYAITWDGRDHTGERVTSGIYFCRMQAGNFSQTRKLMLMK